MKIYKYFLLHNKKLKTWIKYWLYHKKAGGSGVLSEILQGFSFNLANTLNRKFNLFEVEGNSTQDGEPSPDNEVPILSSGDNKNILDKDNANILNVNLSSSAVISGDSPSNRTLYIPVQPNTTYTIQKAIGTVFTIGTTESTPTRNLAYSQRQSDATAKSLTITTNSTAQYLIVWFWVTSDTLTLQEMLNTIKIEQGTQATPYSPYGMGSINEKIQTRNLWSSVWEQGYINANGVNENNSDLIRTKDYIYFEPEQKYAIKRSIATAYTNVRGYDKNKRFIGTGSNVIVSYSGGADNPMQATIQTCVIATKPGVYYLRFNDASNNLSTEYMMVKGDTPTDYVPHQEQDYSIPVQQPMRSIGDVRDKFEQVNGVWNEKHIVYRYKLVKGTITDFNTTYNRLTLLFTGVNVNSGAIAGLSNVAKVLTNVSVNTTYTNSIVLRQRDNGGVYIYCWLDGITSRELAENYLDNNDVYVDFPIATPIYLPCTPEQIQQLENLPSTYKDFTIIQSQDTTPAYLKIQYYKEV